MGSNPDTKTTDSQPKTEANTRETAEQIPWTGVRCLSTDCVFSQGLSPDGCGLKVVYLRKGTCRYYRAGDCTTLDRADLPGESYNDFIHG